MSLKAKISTLLVNIIFYLGSTTGGLLVPVLSLLNFIFLFPIFIYDRKLFTKIQLNIVVFGYVFFGVYLNPFIKFKLESNENTYKGPAIYILNHLSNADPFIVACTVNIHYSFIYKDSLHYIPFTNITLPLAGNIPLRFNYVNNQKIPIKEHLSELFETCKKRIDTGISLFVFPEGTRSKDGKIKPFKHGFFRFAIQHGYPIIPCAICGTDYIFPRFSNVLQPGYAAIRIGKPFWPSDIIDPKKVGNENNKPDVTDIEKLANYSHLQVYKLLKGASNFKECQLVQELEDKLEEEKKKDKKNTKDN